HIPDFAGEPDSDFTLRALVFDEDGSAIQGEVGVEPLWRRVKHDGAFDVRTAVFGLTAPESQFHRVVVCVKVAHKPGQADEQVATGHASPALEGLPLAGTAQPGAKDAGDDAGADRGDGASVFTGRLGTLDRLLRIVRRAGVAADRAAGRAA